MTKTFKALLTRLAEIAPERFQVYADDEYGGELWSADDNVGYFTLTDHKCILPWLIHMLDELKIGAIWKQEGRSWEESMLNAIVHIFEQSGVEE